MGVCLFGPTSLEFWRSYRAKLLKCRRVATFSSELARPPAPRPDHPDALYDCAPRREELRWLLQGPLAGFARPLHLLVPEDDVRRRVDGTVCHASRTVLPVGAILDAGGGLFVSSPSLSIVQAARLCDVPGLSFHASELCGAYALADGACVAFETLPPATLAGLRAGLADIRAANPGIKVRGLGTAERAVRYAVDGAASPAETVLTLLLCLPCALGGYGLPYPVSNVPLEVPTALRPLAERAVYKPDLYWERARLAVEYNGRGHDDRRISLDARRLNAMASSMGLTILVCTYEQLAGTGLFDRLARQVAHGLGVRLQGCRRIKDWAARRDALRARLLPLVVARTAPGREQR